MSVPSVCAVMSSTMERIRLPPREAISLRPPRSSGRRKMFSRTYAASTPPSTSTTNRIEMT
ncbi:hypothetical protein [Streptomyces longisporoflavus]|uniref:hypothetical protein n=1 Tax=Streptomyces longisporoflavus TaxID=28044 RepID=UPI001E2F92F9|nr:hypothetical protein [Streptomyces longisporoflavus]